MNRELYALERRRQRTRDLKAALALAIWGSGCYLLYVAWHARTGWSEPYADAIGTALYLVTFFYLFAFWPILTAVEKLFGGLRARSGGRQPDQRRQILGRDGAKGRRRRQLARRRLVVEADRGGDEGRPVGLAGSSAASRRPHRS